VLFAEGEEVVLKEALYVDTDALTGFLTIMDFECEYCFTATPGVRLAVTEGVLQIDRGKIGLRDEPLRQPSAPVALPLRQWVEIEWRMTMSSQPDGKNVVLVNGTTVIDEDGINFPNREIFGDLGIELPDDIRYHELEVGIPVTGVDADLVLYVDDVSARLAAEF